MKKITFLLIAICCLAITGTAQQQLTGIVIDSATGTPLSGAIIRLEESNQHTITDLEGKFSFSVKPLKAMLHITNIGYEPAEVMVLLPQVAPVKILLTTKVTQLQAVTVSTGYQRIPKERATGSFAAVSGKQLVMQVSTNILDKLAAVASGIMIDKGTSGNAQLMVRGLSTINGPKAPLIVVDGFPYEADLNNINPNTVESISILKDAAAASIWGARAANGVIVITTKNARYNQPVSIEFNSTISLSPKPNLGYTRPISSSDFIDVERQLFTSGFYNDDINASYHPVLSPVVDLLNKEKLGMISGDSVKQALARLKSIDVRDQYNYMYSPMVNQQYAINISGGAQKFSWAAFMGYDDNKDNLSGRYKRSNISFQSNFQPVKQLLLNTAINYTLSEEASGKPGYGSIAMKNNNAVPYMQFADAAGNPLAVPTMYDHNFTDTAGGGRLLDWNYYPLTDWQNDRTKKTADEVRINTVLNYKVIPSLEVEIKHQYLRETGNTENLHDEKSYYARNYSNTFAQIGADGKAAFIVPLGAILDKSNSISVSHNLRGQLNFNNTWNKHAVTAIAGAETRSTNWTSEYNRYYGYNPNTRTSAAMDYLRQYPKFVDGTMEFLTRGQALNEKNNRFISVFANAAYTYNSRYTLSASARQDASNLFGLKTNDQWNPFWSAGGAWQLSNEPFYKIAALPYLKLRASYGFNGNIDPAMVAVSTIAFDPDNNRYTNTRMARFSNYSNPSLKWETSRVINLGIDFNTAKNRLSGSLEYYTKRGTNLFGTAALDYTTGIGYMLFNVASTKGSGWDVQVQSINIDRQVKWTTALNLTIQKDRITTYYRNSTLAADFIGNGQSVPVSGVAGRPIYSIFAYRWAGLDPKTGDPIGYLNGKESTDYASITGNGTSVQDLRFFGSALPTKYGNIINSITYKSFSLDIALSFKLGYWFRRPSIDYTALFTSWVGHSDYSLRWQTPGDEKHTTVPSNTWHPDSNRDNFYNGSAVLVQRADNIRLEFINLGYTVPDGRHKRPFQRLQFFLNARNLGAIWKANKYGIDPDYNFGSNGILPPAIYSLGIRAKL